MDGQWHLMWYTSAVLCLIAGLGFALLAGHGRSVAQPPTETPASGAVTQSIELVPHRSTTDTLHDVDSIQPGVALMTTEDQDVAAMQGRRRGSVAGTGGMTAVMDDSIVTQHRSLTDLSAAESTSHFTHGQLISIV